MDPYPSNYTEAEIAELAAVRRAYPFMVWPMDGGGYAILAECSGKWMAGPFSTVHDAYDEVDRMNAPHQGRRASIGGANAAPGRDARLAG